MNDSTEIIFWKSFSYRYSKQMDRSQGLAVGNFDYNKVELFEMLHNLYPDCAEDSAWFWSMEVVLPADWRSSQLGQTETDPHLPQHLSSYEWWGGSSVELSTECSIKAPFSTGLLAPGLFINHLQGNVQADWDSALHFLPSESGFWDRPRLD